MIDKDGFGYAGTVLKTQAGHQAIIKVRRINLAERLYRITGQGLYRDSLKMGLPIPLPKEKQVSPALVMGQDSVQAVPWQGRLFWLWGDTNVPRYPLGQFRSTCAWSDLPTQGGLQPQEGIALDYLCAPDGNLRLMMPSEEPGVIWIFGLLTVKDSLGKEHLLGHYGRYKSLTERVEHGIAEYDESKGYFRSVLRLEKAAWQHPVGNAVRVEKPEGLFCYFTESFPLIRVRAEYAEILKPSSYEALVWSVEKQAWTWQRDLPPLTQKEEAALIRTGRLPAEQARLQVSDVVSGRAVKIHRASVNWNAYRQAWVMIACQEGGQDSYLGEIWYAEAAEPEGPWRHAIQIASHPRYSFYNPRHHSFFDQDHGRLIYFEGTYTEMFSGNPQPTPRYDYNQVMYRLDLADPRLKVMESQGQP